MAHTTTTSYVDDKPISALQLIVFAICFLINMLDGMDVLIISYAAPSLADDWAIAPTALGAVFSAGLVGMAIGAMGLAPIADRIGRRALVLICILILGSGVYLTQFAQSIGTLIGLRVFSGLAIGAMLASVATMAAEYSPDRSRNLIVGSVMSGFPIGATLAGFVAGSVIPAYGWQTMFGAAGLATLSIFPIVYFLLPESLDFLQRIRPANALQKINAILGKMNAATLERLPEQAEVVASQSVRSLFTDRRSASTAMLWVAFFLSFATLYFLTSWIPKLATNTGLPLNLAIYAGAVFNLGAVFGIVSQGFFSRYLGLRKIISIYMVATAVLMASFSLFSSSWLVLPLIGLIGFALQGGFVGLYTVATRLYPTEIRSTGVGWGIGLGRAGAIISPIIGGVLIGAGLSLGTNFLIFAVPIFLAGIATINIRSDRVS